MKVLVLRSGREAIHMYYYGCGMDGTLYIACGASHRTMHTHIHVGLHTDVYCISMWYFLPGVFGFGKNLMRGSNFIGSIKN